MIAESKPRLTILMCGILARLEEYGRMLYSLKFQSEGKPVEIVTLLDNQHMKVGKKRNELLSLANGEYVCFVDDDDLISNDYVDSILEAIETGEDVVVFTLSRNHNGNHDRLCYYSKEYEKDRDTPGAYYRMPNHLMVFKTDIAQKVKYKEYFFGEDAAWSKEVQKYLKSERKIDKVLYTYQSSDTGSATHYHYKVSAIIHTDWSSKTPAIFIEYAQDLSCIGEILVFSHQDPPLELNFEKVKCYKVDSIDWNEAVSYARFSKICILDKGVILDRYAFHMASGELENDHVHLIGLDERCVERSENEILKTDEMNPIFSRAIFMRKSLFPMMGSGTSLAHLLFDLYKDGAYTIKGPKVFIYE